MMILCRCSSHEQTVGNIAKVMGFTHVSLSSETMPMVRIVPRGFTGKISRCGLESERQQAFGKCAASGSAFVLQPVLMRT